MNVYRYFAILLSAAVLACGCSDRLASVGGRIRIKVLSVNTKGSVITTETLPGFCLDAFVDGSYVNYDSGESFTEGRYINSSEVVDQTNQFNVRRLNDEWVLKDADGNAVPWASRVTTHFFCFYPKLSDGHVSNLSYNYGQGKMMFDYALEGANSSADPVLTTAGAVNEAYADADKMADQLFAYTSKKYSGGSGVVDLTFYHALSQIRYSVHFDGSFDTNLTIRQIALTNVKYSGSCTFNGASNSFAWTPNPGNTNYIHTYNASFKSATVPSGWKRESDKTDDAKYKRVTCSNVFFVMPQELSGVKLKVVFDDNGTLIEKTAVVDSPVQWLAGKYYTYKLTATLLGREINLGVSLEDWENYDDRLFI